MDFSRAWRAVVNDQDWLVKILIGGLMVLLGFLIIPALFVSGYSVAVIRRAAHGDDSLPEWRDWGGLLMRGLLVTAIQIVYALPVFLLACCMVAAATLAGQQGSNANAANDGVTALLVCLTCLIIPFALLAALFTPAATIRYAQHDDISAAFQVGGVLNFIRDNLGNYVVALLASVAVSLLVSIVSSVSCGILLPWLIFFASVYSSHLFGQVAQQDSQRGALGAATSGLPIG